MPSAPRHTAPPSHATGIWHGLLERRPRHRGNYRASARRLLRPRIKVPVSLPSPTPHPFFSLHSFLPDSSGRVATGDGGEIALIGVNPLFVEILPSCLILCFLAFFPSSFFFGRIVSRSSKKGCLLLESVRSTQDNRFLLHPLLFRGGCV